MKRVSDIIPDIDDFTTRRRENFPELNDEVFWEHYEACKPFSMVHVTGFYNAYQSIMYIAKSGMNDAIVECGCFLGGITAFMARVRNSLNLANPIYAFDSFTGFPENSVDDYLGKPAPGPQFSNFRSAVEANLEAAVGSLAGITLVEGMVEDTIPASRLSSISLLRLDTDHYESTRIELDFFYPILSPGGVLIVDDYGLYQGSRRATDDYIQKLDLPPLLNRIDNGIWSGTKPRSAHPLRDRVRNLLSRR